MDYLIHLIETAGYLGYLILFIVIFLESFPPTFFFPGDSLLFTTGFLASQGHFNMAILLPILFAASVTGYMFSYFMGEWLRNFVIRSEDKYWFKKKHLDYTEDFYAKYGMKTIIIARFVPVVRSFAPILAGAAKLNYSRFMRFSIVGGVLWACGLTTVGYYLGKIIPAADVHLTPIILAIIGVSLIPAVIDFIQKKRKEKKIQSL